MPYIKFFDRISKKDSSIAGGKGASLGEMTRLFEPRQARYNPIPPGFVVLAQAFEDFLTKNNLVAEVEEELAQINFEDPNSVEETSERLRGLIEKVAIPKEIIEEVTKGYQTLRNRETKKLRNNDFFVAVRSSATAEDSSVASWAGELETYLYTNSQSLISNLKLCWSSLFTPRALFYRHEKALEQTKISVAVVVQKMINAEVSGVTFTVHPVSKDSNQMVIEAGWGLGEAIVGGLITPDTYVVKKPPLDSPRGPAGQARGKKTKEQRNRETKEEFMILDINVSEQNQMIIQDKKGGTKTIEAPRQARGRQKLTGKQIIELAKICQKIEEHYRSPQDIEWCLEKNKFFIVQSRPITTL